jgi:hypothetical protein
MLLRLNTILFVTGSLLWYVACGLALYSAFGPVRVSTDETSPSRRTTVTNTNNRKQELPPVATFASVWHTPLQRPVFDPPPPPPPVEVKPDPPKLKAQLMATAVDRGQPTTMFKIPSGKYVTLKVGETFDNSPGIAKIIAIDGKNVTLQFEGFDDQITISVQ